MTQDSQKQGNRAKNTFEGNRRKIKVTGRIDKEADWDRSLDFTVVIPRACTCRRDKKETTKRDVPRRQKEVTREMQLQSTEEGKIKESNNADLRVFCNTSARLLFKWEGKGSVRYQSSFSSLRTLSRERPWTTLNEPRVGSMSVAPCDFSRFDSRFAILFLSRALFP